MRVIPVVTEEAQQPVLPVAVEMQAAHGGGVPVQRVHALAALGVPHAQRPVGGAADHRGDGHLAAPHTAAVTCQCAQALGQERAFLKIKFHSLNRDRSVTLLIISHL